MFIYFADIYISTTLVISDIYFKFVIYYNHDMNYSCMANRENLSKILFQAKQLV